MTKNQFSVHLSERRVLLFNKPYRVLSQFTSDREQPTLAHWLDIPHIYPAGRLDADSEGLLILTDDGQLQAQIAHPKYKLEKTYWAQVEGIPTQDAIKTLQQGVQIEHYRTQPAKVRLINEPSTLWTREPPIRHRATIPTRWLEIKISEGKNRQVRKMTAKVGLPTLRLIRVQIGPWTLGNLQPGEYTWSC